MSNEDVNENKYKNERKRFHSRDENLSAYMQEKSPTSVRLPLLNICLFHQAQFAGDRPVLSLNLQQVDTIAYVVSELIHAMPDEAMFTGGK